MDIKKALKSNLIIDSKMVGSYRISEDLAYEELEIPYDVINVFKDKLNSYNIYLHDDDVIYDIIAGILKGNIILQGPPGTGKTTIAKILCEIFDIQADIATAVQDWTSYDTIGGLFPAIDDGGREIVKGKNGIIVESIINCCNNIIEGKLSNLGQIKNKPKYQGSWLILDELNRTEIDKVFAELFTIFGTSDSKSDKKISLWFHKEKDKKELWVPSKYRIIGTMNNYDKYFVNDISNALMRRFTFISILPPSIGNYDDEVQVIETSIPNRIVSKIKKFNSSIIDENSVNNLLTDSDFIEVKNKMYNIMKRIRYENDGNFEGQQDGYLGMNIGTAQVKDFLEATVFNVIVRGKRSKKIYENAFDSAFSSIILPLLEDYSAEKLESFIEELQKDDYRWMNKTKNGLKEL